MSKTSNWKNAEYCLRDVLVEFKIPAYRKTRGDNFAQSDTDVGIENHDNWRLDSKYSQSSPYRHHGKLDVIRTKYCKTRDDIPVLFTKNYKEKLGNITIPIRVFAMLLSFWLGFGSKEELLKIYHNDK